MGNWDEYERWWKHTDDGLRFNHEKMRYTLGFIPAYIKFMYLTLKG